MKSVEKIPKLKFRIEKKNNCFTVLLHQSSKGHSWDKHCESFGSFEHAMNHIKFIEKENSKHEVIYLTDNIKVLELGVIYKIFSKRKFKLNKFLLGEWKQVYPNDWSTYDDDVCKLRLVTKEEIEKHRQSIIDLAIHYENYHNFDNHILYKNY